MDEEKFKKSLLILGLGLVSFACCILGFHFGVIPQVFAVSFGVFSYIFYLDEKRNGNRNIITGAAIFIGIGSAAVSIILIIQGLS